MTSGTSTSTDGGSLRRGVQLLRLLAAAGARGAALTELTQRSGLPHPSVHRVLRQLIAEGLAAHEPETRRYRLGSLTFELGLAGSTLYDIRDLCEPAMRALADATADTVYLVGRSGFDAVCLHRLEGSFPIRTLVLEVGSRRPLGVGAGGLAILAAIDPQERDEIIERLAPALAASRGPSPAALRKACERTIAAGFSVIEGTVNLGVTAVGVALRNSMGQPVAALSVAAMSQRMTRGRRREIEGWLRVAAAETEGRMRSRGAART